MNITTVFFLSLFSAIIAVIPPGLLNITAAKISLKEGHVRAIVFSVGVCFVVVIQTFIAVNFARYLSSHPNVIEILQRVAFVIFVLITVYFFVLANKKTKPDIDPNVKSKKSRFFQGVLLSSLNMFPIPYQAYISITMASYGFLEFNATGIATYIAGTTMGTMVVLYIYIFFFDRIKSNRIKSQKNMNYLIGTITGIISIVTFINIIKEL